MYVDCIGLLVYLVWFNYKFWYIYIYIYIFNVKKIKEKFFCLQQALTIPCYRLGFLKIIPKSIFYQLLQDKADLLLSTGSTITHYPFLCDLHILLFILNFFMHLPPYTYMLWMYSLCKLDFTHGNQYLQQAVKE